MAHRLYGHRDLFRDPASACDLFRNIPRLSGGLFECLERTGCSKEEPRHIRSDGFCRRADSRPVLPDMVDEEVIGTDAPADIAEETEWTK